MSCKNPEPIPKQFYAPTGLFNTTDLLSLQAEWLGEVVTSPGCSFSYRVTTGPCCRIFWDNDRPQPHSFESAWEQVNGKWKKTHNNYVSYAIASGEFITVRWKKPTNNQQLEAL